MESGLLLTLIGTTALLAAIPGPNVALIVARTLEGGRRTGAATVVGTSAGIALQLAAVVLGLAALIELAAAVLLWIKWAGVAYLLWLGIATFRQGRATRPQPPAGKTKAIRQGFLLALINPKTLLFHAAFLPQFVPVDGGGGGGALAVVSVVHLLTLSLCDLIWVLFAGSTRPALRRVGPWRHRLTGLFFIAGGLGLALSRASR